VRIIPITALLACLALDACSGTIKTKALIDQYSRATCVPVTLGSADESPARTWNFPLVTRDGITVQVYSRAVPEGVVDVRYTPDGKDVVAADAGDYIFPADIRFDQPSDFLYIRASGSTIFGHPQTWLFAYDLGRRRQIQRVKVDPGRLPAECPLTPSK
jgi:hypothetical protein